LKGRLRRRYPTCGAHARARCVVELFVGGGHGGELGRQSAAQFCVVFPLKFVVVVVVVQRGAISGGVVIVGSVGS
jgi:hypothetical protein